MSRPATLARTLATAGLAAGAAQGAYRLLRRKPPGGEPTWTRTNQIGRASCRERV